MGKRKAQPESPAATMGKRKAKPETSDEFVDDSGEFIDDSDSDFVVEEPKKARKTPTKRGASGSPKGSPNKPREPPRPKVTEPQTQADGFILHPPSLIYRIADSKPAQKIAAFDMDGTLVVTSSGMAFAQSAKDWKFLNGEVADIVQQFSSDGYKIVIFSNQGQIKSALNGKAAENSRAKFGAIVEKLGIPVSCFMATQKDELRKPQTGMWDFFVREGNSGQQPDLKESFFVGDSAGREGDAVADATDLGFAQAIGLPFKTPEEVFGAPSKGGGGNSTGPNADLANMFTDLTAHYIDNIFKSRAFKKAATAMEECTTKITSLAQAKQLRIPGIGRGCLAAIDEYTTTGKLAVLDPANQAAEQAANAKEAEQKATGDAFAFL